MCGCGFLLRNKLQSTSETHRVSKGIVLDKDHQFGQETTEPAPNEKSPLEPRTSSSRKLAEKTTLLQKWAAFHRIGSTAHRSLPEGRGKLQRIDSRPPVLTEALASCILHPAMDQSVDVGCEGTEVGKLSL